MLLSLLRSELFDSLLVRDKNVSDSGAGAAQTIVGSPASSDTCQSSAPPLAEWLTKLILQASSPAFSASALVGLRKLLQGVQTECSTPSTRITAANDVIVSILATLPAALADLGASHHVLAAIYECDVSDIATEAPLSQQVPHQTSLGQSSNKRSSASAASRADAIDRMLVTLRLIAE